MIWEIREGYLNIPSFQDKTIFYFTSLNLSWNMIRQQICPVGWTKQRLALDCLPHCQTFLGLYWFPEINPDAKKSKAHYQTLVNKEED